MSDEIEMKSNNSCDLSHDHHEDDGQIMAVTPSPLPLRLRKAKRRYAAFSLLHTACRDLRSGGKRQWASAGAGAGEGGTGVVRTNQKSGRKNMEMWKPLGAYATNCEWQRSVYARYIGVCGWMRSA